MNLPKFSRTHLVLSYSSAVPYSRVQGATAEKEALCTTTLLTKKKLQFKMHFCKSSLAVAKNCEPTILRHLIYLSLFIKTKVTLVLNYETLPSANLRANLTCVLFLQLEYQSKIDGVFAKMEFELLLLELHFVLLTQRTRNFDRIRISHTKYCHIVILQCNVYV